MSMSKAQRLLQRATTVLVCLSIALLTGCGNDSTSPEGDDHNIPANSAEYTLFAWNDLGMHCLNPTYDEAVILPPYNTIWAQIVKRGNPPSIVTEGITVRYQIVDNTYSYGKTDALGAIFAGFWDHMLALFGVELPHDVGLNIVDPDIHNGLSGTMVLKGDHFQVNGIPVTPVNDAGVWNPYQVAEITVELNGNVIATTRTTVPTSDEINCGRCHEHNANKTSFRDILEKHDALHGTTLVDGTPLLCASCHGSPALGIGGPGEAGYLSQAIHTSHASRGAACYDCHPGPTTRCSRSLAHTATDGGCTQSGCHGSLADVGGSIADGSRVPWDSEPKCANCHTGVAQVDTGNTLYRNATGHGGMSCPACHGSPHAMFPSRESVDNYQPVKYQGSSKPIGSCGVCHENSRGEGASEFGETHGGTGGRPTACRVCHTSVSAQTAQWPHAFTWKAR